MKVTASTASLAASATMSAQETVAGQKISMAFLAVSMTENPPRDAFPGSVLSVLFPCINTDASQPFALQTNKSQPKLFEFYQ